MTQGVKITLIVVGILGAGVGLYFLFKKPKDKTSPYTTDNDEPSSKTSTQYTNNDFPLKKGSGDIGRPVKRIEALQRYLNDRSYWVDNTAKQKKLKARGAFFEGCSPQLAVDGKWGNNTTGCWLQMRDPNDKWQDKTISEKWYNSWVKKFEK